MARRMPQCISAVSWIWMTKDTELPGTCLQSKYNPLKTWRMNAYTEFSYFLFQYFNWSSKSHSVSLETLSISCEYINDGTKGGRGSIGTMHTNSQYTHLAQKPKVRDSKRFSPWNYRLGGNL